MESKAAAVADWSCKFQKSGNVAVFLLDTCFLFVIIYLLVYARIWFVKFGS